MTRAPVASALLLAFLACSALAADYTGTTAGGYTFGTDVSGYGDLMIKDVCDIAAALDEGNFTLAADIYREGLNNPDKALQGWAMFDGGVEPHFTAYAAYFNDSLWLDSYIEQVGFDGQGPFVEDDSRVQAIKKGIQSNLLVAYMFHEVDEAAADLAAGDTEAAEVIDEAAALWFGQGCLDGNIANVADKRATAWGTLVAGADGACTAATNVAASAALTALRTAAENGDVSAYDAAAKELEKAVMTVYLQATMTYAEEIEEILSAPGNPTEEAQAEGYTFFRTIAPLVAQVTPEGAAAVEAAFLAPAVGINEQVKSALQPAIEAYAITAEELGTFGTMSACE